MYNGPVYAWFRGRVQSIGVFLHTFLEPIDVLVTNRGSVLATPSRPAPGAGPFRRVSIPLGDGWTGQLYQSGSCDSPPKTDAD